MRFMVMHKNDKHTEAGLRPPPELIARMGEFIGEHAQKGQLVDGAGLGGSGTRTRIRFARGHGTIEHGPYAGAHELLSAIHLLVVKSRDEAIAWALRYGEILGDGEIELGPLNEPWDLGLMPKPDDAPFRVLLLHKADAASEAGTANPPPQRAAFEKLKAEMRRAGVLESSTGLAPSAKAKRLHFTDYKLKVVDGPFTESKELIGGFAVLDLASMDAAIHECTRYAEILGGTLEIDIRPLDQN